MGIKAIFVLVVIGRASPVLVNAVITKFVAAAVDGILCVQSPYEHRYPSLSYCNNLGHVYHTNSVAVLMAASIIIAVCRCVIAIESIYLGHNPVIHHVWSMPNHADFFCIQWHHRYHRS